MTEPKVRIPSDPRLRHLPPWYPDSPFSDGSYSERTTIRAMKKPALLELALEQHNDLRSERATNEALRLAQESRKRTVEIRRRDTIFWWRRYVWMCDPYRPEKGRSLWMTYQAGRRLSGYARTPRQAEAAALSKILAERTLSAPQGLVAECSVEVWS